MWSGSFAFDRFQLQFFIARFGISPSRVHPLSLSCLVYNKFAWQIYNFMHFIRMWAFRFDIDSERVKRGRIWGETSSHQSASHINYRLYPIVICIAGTLTHLNEFCLKNGTKTIVCFRSISQIVPLSNIKKNASE